MGDIIKNKKYNILNNRGIKVNLYELYFSFSHFSTHPNKQVFHRSTFPSLKPNKREGKLRLCLVTVFIFYFQKLVLGNIKKK